MKRMDTGMNATLAIGMRWAAALAGLGLIGVAALWVYFPPLHTTTTVDAHRLVNQIVSEPADLGSAIIVLIIAGVSLILFAINGYRFTKFSAAGVSAESESMEKMARRYLAQDDESMPPPRNIQIGEREEPQSTQGPAASVKLDDEFYSVYGVDEVPIQVMADVITNWPADIPRPTSFTEFEFAARKKGKGNHAWEMKFRGKPFVFVSYGGYGKQSATVYGPTSM